MRTFTTLYSVLRSGLGNKVVVIGTFRTLERAEEMADAWWQEMWDKDVELANHTKFEVQRTIFYNDWKRKTKRFISRKANAMKNNASKEELFVFAMSVLDIFYNE